MIWKSTLQEMLIPVRMYRDPYYSNRTPIDLPAREHAASDVAPTSNTLLRSPTKALTLQADIRRIFGAF
jgi:hypothetical protein